MAGVIVLICIVVLAILGGLFGVDSRDGVADSSQPWSHWHNR